MIDRRRGGRSSGPDSLLRAAIPGSGIRVFDERGSASVLVALWSVVLTMLAAGAVVLSSALAAREQVSAAADLAALAGASAMLSDPEQACARAREIAGENGAILTECRVAGTEVWVVAQAPAPAPVEWLVPGRGSHLRARAHAQLTAEDP